MEMRLPVTEIKPVPLVKQRDYPRGLGIICSVLFFMMMGFAIIQSLLVLYTTQVMGFSDQKAYLLNATYNSLIFGLPVLGGYLGNKFLGYTFSVVVGMTIATVGLYFLCFDGHALFYIGLACFIVGNSISVANLFVLLGRLYKKNDLRRESGFTLIYIGINVAACVAIILGGIIVHEWGFQSAILLAAIGFLLSLFTYIPGIGVFSQKRSKLLRAVTEESSEEIREESAAKARRPFMGIFLALLAIPIVMELLYYANNSEGVLLTLGLIAIWFIYQIFKQIDSEQRQTMIAFISLLVLGCAFWALYLLAPSVLLIFIERNVNRQLMGFTIPPSTFLSLGPIFIILIGGAMIKALMYFSKQGKNFAGPHALPYKFAIGLAAMGFAYLTLTFGIQHPDHHGLVAIVWIVGFYILAAIAELMISPISAAMVGNIAPKNFEGMLMGIWLLSIGIGSAISGYLAELTTTSSNLTTPAITNIIYSHNFGHFGGITLSIAVITLLLASTIKKYI